MNIAAPLAAFAAISRGAVTGAVVGVVIVNVTAPLAPSHCMLNAEIKNV